MRRRRLRTWVPVVLGAGVLLVMAGAEDRDTTLAESRELFDAAASPKQRWILPGAGHQDFLACDPTGYESRVVGFLEHQLRPLVRPAVPR